MSVRHDFHTIFDHLFYNFNGGKIEEKNKHQFEYFRFGLIRHFSKQNEKHG
jgi:hypothetical protein